MKFNHNGLKVKDLDEAIGLYESMGFSVKNRFEKSEPHALVATLVDENGAGLELWQFQEEHRLNEFTGRHVAFLCNDARDDAEVLLQNGFTEVIPYTEGVKMNYIFVQDEYGTTYELAEEKQKESDDD
jgi:catechol 2,3-dioxygenase-like lactoylglutathione lyase family enzyme